MCINLWNSLYLADPYIPPVVTRGSYIPVVNIGSCHGASRTKSGPSKKPCTYSQPKCLFGDPFAFIPGDIFIEEWNCKHILVLLANSTGKRGSPACSMSRCCRPKSPPPRCAVRSPRDGFWSHKAATSQTSWAIGASTLPRVDQSVDPLTSPRCPTTWGPSASTKSTPAWTGGRTRSTKPINIVQSVLKSLDQSQSNLLGEESMLGRRIQRNRNRWIFILDYNILPWMMSFLWWYILPSILKPSLSDEKSKTSNIITKTNACDQTVQHVLVQCSWDEYKNLSWLFSDDQLALWTSHVAWMKT